VNDDPQVYEHDAEGEDEPVMADVFPALELEDEPLTIDGHRIIDYGSDYVEHTI
jgi:hypothetical protein